MGHCILPGMLCLVLLLEGPDIDFEKDMELIKAFSTRYIKCSNWEIGGCKLLGDSKQCLVLKGP